MTADFYDKTVITYKCSEECHKPKERNQKTVIQI